MLLISPSAHSLRLDNLGDEEPRHPLAVTVLSTVVLLRSVLEDDDLLVVVVLQHRRLDARALHVRVTPRRGAPLLRPEHAFESNLRSRLHALQRVALIISPFRHELLRAPDLDDGVPRRRRARRRGRRETDLVNRALRTRCKISKRTRRSQYYNPPSPFISRLIIAKSFESHRRRARIGARVDVRRGIGLGFPSNPQARLRRARSPRRATPRRVLLETLDNHSTHFPLSLFRALCEKPHLSRSFASRVARSSRSSPRTRAAPRPRSPSRSCFRVRCRATRVPFDSRCAINGRRACVRRSAPLRSARARVRATATSSSSSSIALDGHRDAGARDRRTP